MTKVVLARLRKEFPNKFVALQSLDLEIADGEFLTLLGPSGCGKSTTLRMIAGLDTPSSGTIHFGDADVTQAPPAARNIAMVFQNYALYPHMTVRGNLEYPLRKRGVPKAVWAEKVAATAASLHIEPLLDRKPRQLSGGQQQRVALGRAMIRDPLLFLLDEPLSNLDAQLRTHMRAELIQLQRRLGKTMIYVTHDQLEAMTMSDRIAVMKDGELRQLATPDEIYNRPADLFVAAFIGAPMINLIEGEVRGTVLHAAGLGLDLPLPGALAAGRGITAGLRPEDVMLSNDGHPAVIKVVEPIGHETILHLGLGSGQLVARVGADASLKAGMPVKVRWRGEKLHLFDTGSGRRETAAPAAA